MNWRSPRTIVALSFAFVAMLAGFFVWTEASRTSAVRLTFLYPTNYPTIGTMRTVGVFELVNSLEESISVGVGFYKKSARVGVTPSEGDFSARPLTPQPVASFAAQSTNVFEMSVPPMKGGPYRAVLHCSPASKTTQTLYWSRLVRLAGSFWAKAWGSPTMWGGNPVDGTVFAESQPFEIKP